MRSRMLCVFLSLSLFCLLVAYPMMALDSARAEDDVPFTTLDKGDMSWVFSGDPDYLGKMIVIRNRSSLESFWVNHSGGAVPTNVSWDSQMVIAGILGYQTCLGPDITFLSAKAEGETLYVYFEEYFVPSYIPCSPAISNPFHIIAIDSYPEVVFAEGPPADGPSDSQGPIPPEILLWVGFPMILVVTVLVALLLAKRRTKNSDESRSKDV